LQETIKELDELTTWMRRAGVGVLNLDCNHEMKRLFGRIQICLDKLPEPSRPTPEPPTAEQVKAADDKAKADFERLLYLASEGDPVSPTVP
jgi:hypothetical protein